MKFRITFVFFLLFHFFIFQVSSQDAIQNDDDAKNGNLPCPLLIPVIEKAFSGEINWRPDWPDDIPPDGFSFLFENKNASVIELFNDENKFSVKRDSENRLLEFPFFSVSGNAKVEAVYAESGALLNMIITLLGNEDNEGNNDDEASENSDDQQEEKIINVTFPVNFLPYSILSPGGSFPPLTVSADDSVFYVFIFESPAFLTETWYDSEGEMVVFCKAVISRDDSKWRITSLQIHETGGVRFEDYYYDSFGNITSIHLDEDIFSAVYRERLPVYWRLPGIQYELQWDRQGFLTVIKALGESGDLDTEYRYDYKRDASGNWIERQETAFMDKLDLLAPQPSFSRGTWNRRIGD